MNATIEASDALRRLDVKATDIAAFCRRRHICKLAFFGSVLRNDFGPDSDVDVLYEFKPGCNPGLHIMEVVDELSALLGRKVDFVPAKGVRNPFLRRSILSHYQVVYAA